MATFPCVVLRNIAEAVINNLDDDDGGLRNQDVSTLRALRLTCSELAGMASIKRALFSNINLHATQNNMLKVKQTDFNSIGPYIRQINFLPSPYFHDLSISKYKRMLDLHYALIRSEPGICSGCVESSSDFLDIQNADLLSEDEISTRYQSYMERARKDQHSAIDGPLPKVWIKMLWSSEYVDTIRLCPVSKALSQMPYRINEPPPGECPRCWSNIGGLMNDFSGGSGDCLMTAVVECLASTALPIKTLSIDCELKNAPTADWREPCWDNLRLSRLETVTISDLPYSIRDHWEDESLERGNNAEMLYVEVLLKVHETVQHVQLLRDFEVSWMFFWPDPPRFHVEFPCLRSLELQRFVITPIFFKFIATCTALDTLKLKACQMGEEDDQWKDFFDSVRKRTGALHITCDNLHDWFGPWYFDSGLGIGEDGTLPELGLQRLPTLQKSLFLYLAGCGDWDSVLERHFPQTWE